MDQALNFESHRHQRRRANLTRGLVYYAGVGLLAVVMLYPVAWLVASSLKPLDEIWTNVTSLIPSALRFENYAEGWQGFGGISFQIFFGNSFVHAGVGTLFTVISSAVVAYGFARVKFRGRDLWFSIMLMTLMLPSQILMIPQYIIFNELGWINTFLPLLIPRLGGDVFFIFMIIQFIRGIPIELDEAAMIDGCSKGGIFFRIILPQITPALVTAAIFSFYWTWEDFLGPLVYLQNPNMYTVALALRAYTDLGSVNNWGAVFAMLTLSLVPVILIFVFFQRYLVEGIATTGLKG
ncbi:MAG: carbohydrate ABC transporter permease [Anaerolineae bacterium]|nr:carbohydrate ABC transporter permease [Anaerolineae bacterium]NUQ03039.1 carbohydrate ABC transporter permease [Anaerolineae bacterium]